MSLMKSEEGWDQTFQRYLGRRYEGGVKSIERAESESVKNRTKWQFVLWLLHQTSPCSRAMVSAVKLEVIGPAKKKRGRR